MAGESSGGLIRKIATQIIHACGTAQNQRSDYQQGGQEMAITIDFLTKFSHKFICFDSSNISNRPLVSIQFYAEGLTPCPPGAKMFSDSIR